MLLDHLDTHQLVCDQMSNYLTSTTLDFETLNQMILSKRMIAQVQSKVSDWIMHSKDMDYFSLKQNLEKKFYQLQIDEDTKAHHQTTRRQKELSSEQLTIKTSHEKIPTQILELQGKCLSLQLEKNHLLKSKQSTLENDRLTKLQQSLIEYEFKILNLVTQQTDNERKLHDIKQEMQHLQQQEKYRKSRKQARDAYDQSIVHIDEVLSPTHAEQLKKSLKKHNEDLENKAQKLISDAEQINYATFIDLLEKQLPSMTLSPKDIEATQQTIQQMVLHLNKEKEASDTKALIENHKNIATKNTGKVNAATQRALTIAENQTTIGQNINSLKQRIATLTPQLTALKDHIRKLKISILVLTGITMLASIPLALYMLGMMTAFASVAISYAVLSSAPAALSIATTGIGIAASVYHFKGKGIDAEIKSNEQTITNQEHQLNKEQQELVQLNNTVIPKLKTKVAHHQKCCDQLDPQLQTIETASKQFFKKAAISGGFFKSNDMIELQINGDTPLKTQEPVTLSPGS